MKLNQRSVFLFDGVGALASAFFSGVLLPVFSESIGIETRFLQMMAVLPLCYCVYSFGCYYCLIPGILIAAHPGLTVYGKALFLAEIAVILFVVAVEAKVYRRSFRGRVNSRK